jgi:hypothetical protein
MHRKACTYRPEISQLESKVLFSLTATAIAVSGNPADVAIRLAVTPTALTRPTNVLTGHYFATEDGRLADAPLDAKLDGTGKVRGLGLTSLSGSLQFGGFGIAGQPDINGTITLTNAKGSVTLRLTGRGGNGEIPDATFTLKASVVNGTGCFSNVRRIGTATAHFGPNNVASFAAPCPIGGALTVKLRLSPPMR